MVRGEIASAEAKPLYKHAGIVCKCHQLNRAKGSREELPCKVKGQRPLGSPNKHAGIV